MSAKTWFSIRASASPSSAVDAEIDIFDHIGKFGISAEMFISALRPLKGKNVTFNINCPGGSCNEGLSIYDAISEFTGTVTMNVVGIAASMASVIILAAKNRTISANGRVMMHRVTAGIEGNPDQLQAGTDLARQFEDRIVRIYSENLKLTEQQIRDKMKTEIGSWFFGEDAVNAGFATSINAAAKPCAFKAEWASMFTMLPSAMFDTAAFEMEKPSTPPAATAAPVEPPAPDVAPVAPPVEPPVAPPADENPPSPDPVEPAAPEARGFIERAVAALTGSSSLKAEAETLRAENVQLTGRIDNQASIISALTAERDGFKAQIATLEAAVSKAEAEKKTTGQAAAAIAAAHGLTPERLAALPAPAGEAASILDQLDAITDPAERTAFFQKNKAAINAAFIAAKKK